MTSEEAIKTAQVITQSLEQNKEVKTPNQSIKMLKDSKLPPENIDQTILLEKFSKE